MTVITNYNNRQPALVEKPLGRGKVLTMTTPVSESANDPNAWNMLATGFEPWPFVMLSNEMLLYLAGTADERFNFTAGEEVILQIPEAQRGMTFTLTNPAGDVLSPNVNQVTGLLRTQATEFAGQYRLRAGGTEGGVSRGFSVNIPATLSELTRLTNDELETRFGKGTYHLAKTKEEIDRTVSTARTGTELFPLLILLWQSCWGQSLFSRTSSTSATTWAIANRARRWPDLPRRQPRPRPRRTRANPSIRTAPGQHGNKPRRHHPRSAQGNRSRHNQSRVQPPRQCYTPRRRRSRRRCGMSSSVTFLVLCMLADAPSLPANSAIVHSRGTSVLLARKFLCCRR